MEAPQDDEHYSVFISHAWEDKASFVGPLAGALAERRIKVWYDEFTISPGDSLTSSINRGLALSRFAVVVVSPAFVAKFSANKGWATIELRSLFSLQVIQGISIIQVWYNVDRADLARHAPILLDGVAIPADEGVHDVADKIANRVAPKSEAERLQRILDERKIYKIRAWNEAYVHLDSIYELRQKMYSSFPRDYKLWTSEQKAVGNKITIALNRVAYFVFKGLLEEELVLDENAGTFAWSWEWLEEHVRELRRLSNQPENAGDIAPDQGTPQRYHFEWLAKRALKKFPRLSRRGDSDGSPEPEPESKPEPESERDR